MNLTFLGMLVLTAQLVIIQFFWRMAATRWSDKPIGKALAYLN